MVGQHWQNALAATLTIACLKYKTHDYLLCVKQTQWFVIILLLLLNSSDSGVEISERLHQLADGLPDQGTSLSNL